VDEESIIPTFFADTVAVLRYLQGSPFGRAPALAGERANAAELFLGGNSFGEEAFSIFAVFGLARNGGVQPPKQSRDLALATNLL
jgi:hypothetical protein